MFPEEAINHLDGESRALKGTCSHNAKNRTEPYGAVEHRGPKKEAGYGLTLYYTHVNKPRKGDMEWV